MGKNTNVVGICCQHGKLSLSHRDGRGIMRSVVVDVPENIVEGTEIRSSSLFSALISETMKTNGIKCKNAAYVISGEDTFERILTMPAMDEEQILNNIPFEFKDYITGELENYVFDYAFVPAVEGDQSADPSRIKVMAAAVHKDKLNEINEILGVASLKPIKVVPDYCVFEKILAELPLKDEQMKERCFIDIGRNTTRLFIYKNGRYKLMHMIHIGVRRIAETIADVLSVDIELARTYMYTDYNNCTSLPECINVYRDISVEILKGLNFYEMSDMTARLGDVILCGAGTSIKDLCKMLTERITMNVNTMGELFPHLDRNGVLGIAGPSVGAIL